MAFKRADLAGLGIEADKIQILIDWHMETVKGLQAKIDENKDNSDELTKVKAELEQAKNDLKTANDKIAAYEKDDYKTKYESEKAAREKLESDNANRETFAKKEKAFKSLLKDKQYSEEAAKLIIGKGGYTDKIELDGKGNIKNADSILGDVQSDFAMFTPKENNQSSNPANPPANIGGKISKTAEEIMNIKDTEARQLAMAQNAELFGIT